MIEKVNPSHPDKLADRIAGAIVDYAYSQEENPRMAVEVLLGHRECLIITESSVIMDEQEMLNIVTRIAGDGWNCRFIQAPQDSHLSKNQQGAIRCGDNGIFKGVPLSEEEKRLAQIARDIYEEYRTDGKYILVGDRLIICQSNAHEDVIRKDYPEAVINPLGYWTGGTLVDSGATNRKLGSDMGRAVTGGGLHGKDLSKADVSINIYAHLKAQERGEVVELHCAIGDEKIIDNGQEIPYSDIVKIAREYVFDTLGGFEKLAEWGLF